LVTKTMMNLAGQAQIEPLTVPCLTSIAKQLKAQLWSTQEACFDKTEIGMARVISCGPGLFAGKAENMCLVRVGGSVYNVVAQGDAGWSHIYPKLKEGDSFKFEELKGGIPPSVVLWITCRKAKYHSTEQDLIKVKFYMESSIAASN